MTIAEDEKVHKIEHDFAEGKISEAEMKDRMERLGSDYREPGEAPPEPCTCGKGKGK